MNLLLDTHVLIWSATESRALTRKAIALIQAEGNSLWYSVASLWEVAIKNALKRPDFPFDAGVLRAGLIANGYEELVVEGRHAASFRDLPALHRDPFDRMLVAQARAEGLVLVTADRRLAQYGGQIEFVG